MAIEYGLTAKPPKTEKDWGTITFNTSSKEMYEEVLAYIQTVVDATSWRNRVQRIEKVI